MRDLKAIAMGVLVKRVAKGSVVLVPHIEINGKRVLELTPVEAREGDELLVWLPDLPVCSDESVGGCC